MEEVIADLRGADRCMGSNLGVLVLPELWQKMVIATLGVRTGYQSGMVHAASRGAGPS